MRQITASALIAAKPGRMRNSLQALLMSIPQITLVSQADDGPSTLEAIALNNPTLVLLDTNIPDGQTWVVLSYIKTKWPQIKCLILTNNIQEQQAAKITGADIVLLKGFPTTTLFSTIEKLLVKHNKIEEYP